MYDNIKYGVAGVFGNKCEKVTDKVLVTLNTYFTMLAKTTFVGQLVLHDPDTRSYITIEVNGNTYKFDESDLELISKEVYVHGDKFKVGIHDWISKNLVDGSLKAEIIDFVCVKGDGKTGFDYTFHNMDVVYFVNLLNIFAQQLNYSNLDYDIMQAIELATNLQDYKYLYLFKTTDEIEALHMVCSINIIDGYRDIMFSTSDESIEISESFAKAGEITGNLCDARGNRIASFINYGPNTLLSTLEVFRFAGIIPVTTHFIIDTEQSESVNSTQEDIVNKQENNREHVTKKYGLLAKLFNS